MNFYTILLIQGQEVSILLFFTMHGNSIMQVLTCLCT